ncbi:MAG: DedA family protein [Planctomycetia bacterium]|nr:DedA family protein [Planctomycetia bacterium]
MIDYLSTLGPVFPYVAIVLFLALTGAGLPVPEEVFIVAAGMLSVAGRQGVELSAPVAFACCVLGALLGDNIVYAAGRYLGRSFFQRHRWFARWLNEDRERQMEALIKKHGLKMFFAARFMIGVRAPIYVAAGLMRVPWPRFLLVDTISATVVVGTVFGLSYRYGEQIRRLVREFSIGMTVLGVVAVAIATTVYFVRSRRPPTPPHDDEDDSQSDDSLPGKPGADDSRVAQLSA